MKNSKYLDLIHRFLPFLFPISVYTGNSGKVSLPDGTMNNQEVHITGMAFRSKADIPLTFTYADRSSRQVCGYNEVETC